MHRRYKQTLCILIGVVGVWSWVYLPTEAVGPLSAIIGFIGGMGTVHYAHFDALWPDEETDKIHNPNVENDPELEYVECDDCGEKSLPARKEGAQATRGFQCQNCGYMY